MDKHVVLERLGEALDEHAIVSITDVAGNIAYVNQKFLDISGYTLAELLGKNHRILKSGIHPASFYKQMWDTVSSGNTWHGEVCNRRKDGKLYWVRASVKPILDSSGLPLQYVSIRTDITDIKESDAKLQVTNAELEVFKQVSEYEMDLTRKLMEHIIHNLSTQVKDVELWLQPAAKMSGDLAITQNYNNERSYILLADAMGHGLPAAMPLMPVAQVFSTMVRDGFTISAIVREMNRKIKNLIPVGNFVAVTLLSIDHVNHCIEIWNGGNPPALLLNGAGEVVRKFTAHNPAIGILRNDNFDSTTELFHWHGEHWLMLYSDGLVDAQDVHGDYFGEERVVRELRGSNPHQSLKNAVLAHLGGSEAGDDISLATIFLQP
jgi:PAS domain S-box-containing protein